VTRNLLKESSTNPKFATDWTPVLQFCVQRLTFDVAIVWVRDVSLCYSLSRLTSIALVHRDCFHVNIILTSLRFAFARSGLLMSTTERLIGN